MLDTYAGIGWDRAYAVSQGIIEECMGATSNPPSTPNMMLPLDYFFGTNYAAMTADVGFVGGISFSYATDLALRDFIKETGLNFQYANVVAYSGPNGEGKALGEISLPWGVCWCGVAGMGGALGWEVGGGPQAPPHSRSLSPPKPHAHTYSRARAQDQGQLHVHVQGGKAGFKGVVRLRFISFQRKRERESARTRPVHGDCKSYLPRRKAGQKMSSAPPPPQQGF